MILQPCFVWVYFKCFCLMFLSENDMVHCFDFFVWSVSACSRIVQMRYPNAPSLPAAVPSTPNHSQRSFYASQTSSKPYDSHSNSSQSTSSSGTLTAGQVPGVGEAGSEAVPVVIDRYLIFNAQSTMAVMSGQITKLQVNAQFTVHETCHFLCYLLVMSGQITKLQVNTQFTVHETCHFLC